MIPSGPRFDVFSVRGFARSDRRDEVYLDEVDRCDVYLALLDNDYGYEDANGISPTEREFDRGPPRQRASSVRQSAMTSPAVKRCRPLCAGRATRSFAVALRASPN